MFQVNVILGLIVGAIVIGAALFFPMRWFLTRNNPAAADSPKVSPIALVQAALIVMAMLALAWHMEDGNKIASAVWGLAAAGGLVWLLFARTRQNDKD